MDYKNDLFGEESHICYKIFMKWNEYTHTHKHIYIYIYTFTETSLIMSKQ